MNKLTRRSFLAILSLLPTTAGATIGAQQLRQDKYEPGYHQKWLRIVAKVIGPYQSVVMVGRCCGQPLPLTALSTWTGHFIDALNKVADSADNKSLSSLRAKYQLRVREDFLNSRTTRINGYILSQTEVEVWRIVNAIENDQ